MTAGPDVIWLDPRVAATIPTEPKGDPSAELQYFRSDIVESMVEQAQGGKEFFIQILEQKNVFPTAAGGTKVSPSLYGLTNYGRIYYLEVESKQWSDAFPLPDFSRKIP